MKTQFTMNAAAVAQKYTALKNLDAVMIAQHEEIEFKLDTCGNGCCNQVGLPKGTTFVIEGHYSRNALKKLFGHEAMIRGVKHTPNSVDTFELQVEDLAGFNFVANPFHAGTHIFWSFSGVFVCTTPSEGDRFKYQRARAATAKEEQHYLNLMNEELKLQEQADLSDWE
jgi:hypothetical protein